MKDGPSRRAGTFRPVSSVQAQVFPVHERQGTEEKEDLETEEAGVLRSNLLSVQTHCRVGKSARMGG